MGKSAQKHIERLFKKPTQLLVWELYYGEKLSVAKIAAKVSVSTRTVGTWMRDWGYDRREYGKDLQVPPRPEVKANG